MSYTSKIDTPSTQDGSYVIQVKSIPPSTQDGSCLIQVKSIPVAHRMAHVDFTCIRHEPSCVLGGIDFTCITYEPSWVLGVSILLV